MLDKVEQGWETFKTDVLPPALSKDELDRLRLAFFSGATETMILVSPHVVTKSLAAAAVVNSVKKELEKFNLTEADRPGFEDN